MCALKTGLKTSSQSMESDIIVDGFQQAEKMHGLRYMSLIADGDSSVFARIQQDVPVWGSHVHKIECANHMCKRLRSNLEKLVDSTPAYKGQNRLTKATRVRIVSSVRCAIRMRSREANKQKAAIQLAKDIRNSVHHIFGCHDNCSDFCKAKPHVNTPGTIPTNDEVLPENMNDEPSELCSQTSLLWSEGSSLEQQEQSRYACSLSYSNLTTSMLQDISVLLGRVAEKSHRLIENATSNLAECWMHIRSKFDGGKLYNICNRGSWHTRCYGGSLRMNLGMDWSPQTWKKCTGTSPGHHFIKLYKERDRNLHLSNISKKNPRASMLRWKRKTSALRESTSKAARQSYGSEALDPQPDISEDQLEAKKSTFYKQHIDLPPDRIKAIESCTVLQSQSQVWHDERKKRLTASVFGNVVKRNPKLPVCKLVQQILYSKFTGNQHTRTGLQQERATIHEYVLRKAEEGVNVDVRQSGLVINNSSKFLGASPDGIVYENGQKCGIIEVKNVLHNKSLSLTQAAKSNKTFCLHIKEGKLQLKQNHNYFIQCQALIFICDLPWTDFVIRTLNPYQMHVERIFPNDNLWKQWFPKLEAFYYKALLPELSCPRKGKIPGIREPGVWFEASKKSAALNSKKGPSSTDPKTQPVPGCSESQSTDPLQLPKTRRTVSRSTKFVGRRISHEWKLGDSSEKTEWYPGTVTAVLSGCDGSRNATYEVMYDGDDELYEVDHLMEDYEQSSVKFIDI